MDQPEKKIREVIDACADCDVCRYLMDTSCLVFPELYRLYDKEKETGEAITAGELRNLVDMCNFCALCPCPNIRADIMSAKTLFIQRDGLPFNIRMLEDVERVGKWCGTFPQLFNWIFRNKKLGSLSKQMTGIHADRRIPQFPKEHFPAWAKQNRLDVRQENRGKRKVAYFAGCTAKYLFPEVPKAAVNLLRNIGVDVYFMDQQCCGMPTLLEGDRELTLKFVSYNVERLSEAITDGYDIVCSCPTCGYMLKSILKEGAYYSSEYQESVGADATYLKLPARHQPAKGMPGEYRMVRKCLYGNILKDNSYFAEISAYKRIKVAENTYDLGEYLLRLHREGQFQAVFNPMPNRIAYYPPCHLREQNIGTPYLNLLKLIPDLMMEPVESSFYCCGMAGIMGFKKEFHERSIQFGNRLMEAIEAVHPEMIATDCLSCRVQFNQQMSYQVKHPVEILMESIGN